MLDSLSKSPEIALAALAVLCVTVIFGQAEIEGAERPKAAERGRAGAWSDSWRALGTTRLVAIDVEQALYEKAGQYGSFIHVRLTNRSERPVGVDLQEHERVIYANTWTKEPQERRVNFNEKRLIHKPFDKAARTALLEDFRAGKLTVLPPGKSIDYYSVAFYGGRHNVDEKEDKYLILSLDGEQLVTDGAKAERFSLQWGSEGNKNGALTDLVIPTPVPWKLVPVAGRIGGERLSSVPQTATEGPWGESQAGLQCRLTVLRRLEQGMPLDATVAFRSIPKQLPPGVAKLNRFYPDPCLELTLVNLQTKAAVTVLPYGPAYDLLVRDGGKQLVPLPQRDSWSLGAQFPLAPVWGKLKPGTYEARVQYSFPGRYREGWWHGTPAAWDALWKGTILSGPVTLDVLPATPKTEILWLPKRLRFFEDHGVIYTREDAEKVEVPRRNGFFLGFSYGRWVGGKCEVGSLGCPVPKPADLTSPNDIDPFDHCNLKRDDTKKVSYKIEVFESPVRPGHMWHPQGSEDYRVLWEKTVDLLQGAEPTNALASGKDPARKEAPPTGKEDIKKALSQGRAGDSWQTLGATSLATIDVEKALYEKGGESFFIHVRLTNRSERPVGVDLQDHGRVVYPNAWSKEAQEYRVNINEKRVIHKPFDEAARAAFLEDFKAGKLTLLPPGKSLDYYSQFDRGDRFGVSQEEDKYLILSLDGEQLVTDGAKVERFSLEWGSEDNKSVAPTDLAIPTPVPWKLVPVAARIGGERLSSVPKTATEGPWSETRAGLQCRLTVLRRLEQGMPLDAAVAFRSIPKQLSPGVTKLDRYFADDYLEITLLNLQTKAAVTVRPYRRRYNFLANDEGKQLVPLNQPDSLSLGAQFPLATEWGTLKPGTYKARVQYSFPGSYSNQWWRGTPALWDALWKGAVVSGPVTVDILPATPKTEIFWFPKRLRVEGHDVSYTKEDAEKVEVPRRNGFFLGTHFALLVRGNWVGSRIGNFVPKPTSPNESAPFDHFDSDRYGTKKVSYMITVFESSEPAGDRWSPGGAPNQHDLWTKTVDLLPAEKKSGDKPKENGSKPQKGNPELPLPASRCP